ncbi:hypothetical protein GKA01_16690 [Gluconobacter kanchanaburiensis NBRC 103587]|uniref:Uncharacterized protein n=1 Tax=Gluconobacter kanchanaburiensis NBRC 103587 TaxID=1307948 RepID=A0A511B9U3_9PROT|nr:hypothetical protein AA103587_0942 [Gluconobacter kanchanaburiensis NBRC 103587]GEK96472.1 hypothetical protein GKA01_16690 [Gluconobacter kanchanaburiensis NBRC 103587]
MDGFITDWPVEAVPVTRISSGSDLEMMDVLRGDGLAGDAMTRAEEFTTRRCGLCADCACVVALAEAACAGGQNGTSELRAAPHIRKALGPKHLLMGIPFSGLYAAGHPNICFS